MRCVFAIPGPLDRLTGGYVYARKILSLLAGAMEIEVLALPPGFPLPSQDALDQAGYLLSSVNGRGGTALLADGLAYGALPGAIIAKLDFPIVALLHHPLCLEQGLDQEIREALWKSEAAALSRAVHVIVSSPATANALTQMFAVPAGKITVAEPGIMRGERAKGSAPGRPVHIVSAGTLTPRKGFEILIEALNIVRDLPWRVTIAGTLDVKPAVTTTVRAKIRDYDLAERVNLAGPLEEKALSELYSSGDFFALASYYEGYGMAFAEAMAHGLPVVASGEGAVRATVPANAGFVCAPGNAEAIAGALRKLLVESPLRHRVGDAGWDYGKRLPEWPQTAEIIAGVLRRVLS